MSNPSIICIRRQIHVVFEGIHHGSNKRCRWQASNYSNIYSQKPKRCLSKYKFPRNFTLLSQRTTGGKQINWLVLYMMETLVVKGLNSKRIQSPKDSEMPETLKSANEIYRKFENPFDDIHPNEQAHNQRFFRAGKFLWK